MVIVTVMAAKFATAAASTDQPVPDVVATFASIAAYSGGR